MRVRYQGSDEQRVEHRAGALKIGGRLEQRHHALRMRIAGELLQQLDGEDVRRAARHRDHVGAERLGRQRRSGAEGVEHVANRVGIGSRVRRQSRRTSACRSRSRGSASRSAPLRTRLVRARGSTPCDPRHGFGMAGRFLTQVERRERQSERGDAAKDVGEPAGGDQPVAGRRRASDGRAAAAPRTRRPSRNGRRGAVDRRPRARSAPRRARASRARRAATSRSSAR